MRKELCGNMVKLGVMTEARPCIRKKGHPPGHTPNLRGMRFGYGIVISISPCTEQNRVWWFFRNRYGEIRKVVASSLIRGVSTGTLIYRGSGKGSTDGFGKVRSEYKTIERHFNCIFNSNNRQHKSYKNMKFYDGWNAYKGSSFIVGMHWIIENLGPKPGPDWQLHVLKTKKHPHGFFGPGGIVWRHKVDRHDQQALDVISEMSDKKFKQFVKMELRRRESSLSA